MMNNGWIIGVLFASTAIVADAKMNALIVHGQSSVSHQVWPKSTLMMKQYLEETGLFDVDVALTKFTWYAAREAASLPLAGAGETQDLENAVPDPDFSPDFKSVSRSFELKKQNAVIPQAVVREL